RLITGAVHGQYSAPAVLHPARGEIFIELCPRQMLSSSIGAQCPIGVAPKSRLRLILNLRMLKIFRSYGAKIARRLQTLATLSDRLTRVIMRLVAENWRKACLNRPDR